MGFHFRGEHSGELAETRRQQVAPLQSSHGASVEVHYRPPIRRRAVNLPPHRLYTSPWHQIDITIPGLPDAEVAELCEGLWAYADLEAEARRVFGNSEAWEAQVRAMPNDRLGEEFEELRSSLQSLPGVDEAIVDDVAQHAVMEPGRLSSAMLADPEFRRLFPRFWRVAQEYHYRNL